LTDVAVPAAYCLVAFLFFGLPAVAHPGRTVIASETDPNIFIWSFAWWPHALLHGQNPIFTHAIWAPYGYDLSWATAIPGLAIVLAPVTLLAGPVVSYNVAAVLLPALAAWTAFLLCRYVTRRVLPSLFGGYLFGFSSYMLAHEGGHMNLAANFPVPLIALAILRRLDGEISRRGLALRLGILLAAEVSFSTEIFATVTFTLAISLAIAFVVCRSLRSTLRALAAPLTAGYALATIVASPLLYYALTDFSSGAITPTGPFVADAANLVIPTTTVEAGGAAAVGISSHFSGNEYEQGAYLGVPLLLIVALYCWSRRRGPARRFLLVATAVMVILAFGSRLQVEGHRTLPLPWLALRRLPVLDNVFAGRLMLYAILGVAVIAALWAGSRQWPLVLRFALPVLAVVSLFPALGQHHWDETFAVPSFFRNAEFQKCLARGENVLVVPYSYLGNSLLWQALSGFWYRMPGGQIGPRIPDGLGGDTDVVRLLHDDTHRGDGGTIRRFAHRMGVTTILVDPTDPWYWTTVLAGFGQPRRVGGVLLYSVARKSTIPSACGSAR
jgi:hypothetical protein